MPLLKFRCEKCGKVFDELVRVDTNNFIPMF